MTVEDGMHDRQRARRQWWRKLAIGLVALALAMFNTAAAAQDEDLPGRVGRLAEFGGQILFSTQDRPDDWEPVSTNYPITSGANLWASTDGRAEVDYGAGQFRLAGDTNVHVARLDDRQLTLFVAQGRVIVRVRVQDPGEATFVDTPNSQLTLLRPGLYRIDVARDRESTTLIVREGEANVALPGEARQVLTGQAITIGGREPVVSQVRYAQAADAFDTWSADRDRGNRGYEGSRTAAYVSRQMVGASDLDRYGAWQDTREYGPVWFPYAAAPSWAPYSDGYWVDIGGWGPTWVDSAPWGYAPFHYGRWAFIGGRWGWCPGGYVARPVWAPALVAWYGGPGFGAGVYRGGPLYGWVPLGWREPYYPGWRRCSSSCWARFNRPYGVKLTASASAPPARHVNLAVPGALSAVPATSLAGRAPVRPNLVRVPGDLASSATPMRTIPPIRTGERQAPTPPSDSSAVPRAASTYARVPTAEAAFGGTSRQAGPSAATAAPVRPVSPQRPESRGGVTGTLPPATSIQGIPARPTPSPRGPETAAPPYGTRRAGAPPTDLAPQRAQPRPALPVGLAPSRTSTLPPGAAASPPMSVAPRAAPPVAAPLPAAPSLPAPPANPGAGRGVARSVPEPPSAPEVRR